MESHKSAVVCQSFRLTFYKRNALEICGENLDFKRSQCSDLFILAKLASDILEILSACASNVVRKGYSITCQDSCHCPCLCSGGFISKVTQR